MGGVVVCLCLYVCVRVSLLFPLIKPLGVNWHGTDPPPPTHTHADLQIPQLMTALPQPANNNLSLSDSLSFSLRFSHAISAA